MVGTGIRRTRGLSMTTAQCPGTRRKASAVARPEVVALINVQRWNGLEQDGRCGKKTWIAIDAYAAL